MFQIGDIVKIKPEWMLKTEDPNARYIVTNVNEVTRRCFIKSLSSELVFPGEELVGFNMIEPVAAERTVYTVQLYRKDGRPPEEHEYPSKEAAIRHFESLKTKPSKEFSRIALTETRIGLPETVIESIQF